MTGTKTICKSLFLSGVMMLAAVGTLSAQYAYTDTPLIKIIEDVEQRSEYRFLYRNALIADISLTLNSPQRDLFTGLREALQIHHLSLTINEDRKQAIITQFKPRRAVNQLNIKGQVLNANTGERLPYAAITWKYNGRLQGLSTNESGGFSINREFNQSSIDITCSYFGYTDRTVTLPLEDSANIDELTFRLEPDPINASQLLVTGSYYYDNINQQSSGLIDVGAFSPMGESNTMTALQSLPSVSVAPAMSGNVNIRGSSSDGLRVIIDDITIYNQSHLFGLIDSFNGDVLQRSGFYYDIAPLKYQAPPGGTLSLLTKTGSLDSFSGSAGLSNSSVRFSLGGPIQQGKSSWLLSARKSYMNALNWLNNSDLVSWGLNVNRPQGRLGDGLVDLQPYLVQPGETSASFYDLHGKVYFEGNNGNRLILSGYFGGDDTDQQSERLFGSLSVPGSNQFIYEPVSTTNNWQNGAASAKYQQWLRDDIFSSSVIGMSIYKTAFNQDDFSYLSESTADQSLQAFIFSFQNESVLNEFKAEQSLEFSKEDWMWSTGIIYNYYLGEYYENSFDRPGYFSSVKSHKIDTYTQFDYTGQDDIMNVFAGARFHYYSNGNFFRWSPRVKMKFFPRSVVSLSAGFSRNHQFVNQISLSNAITTDVWILAGKNQPPTSANYYTTGAYFSFSKFFYFQAEAYIKNFENARLHEINTFSLSNTYETDPWFVDNSGTGKGIELLARSEFSIAELTQTLAFSEVTLSNPQINNGDSFYADWDRSFRSATMLRLNPFSNFSAFFSWNYASGTPNQLATFGIGSGNRLGAYRRTDVSAEYKVKQESFNVVLSASVFNVFDRKNPWYRNLNIVVDQNRSPEQFTASPVDVYDIGIQPSFNIKVSF